MFLDIENFRHNLHVKVQKFAGFYHGFLLQNAIL